MWTLFSLSSLRSLALIAVVSCFGLAASAQVPRPTRDEGLLDPAWFSTEDLEFRASGKLDYLWVRPGFRIDGRTLQFMPWTEPSLPSGRDDKDRAAAEKLNESFPPRLAEVFAERLAGKAKIVPADGELGVFGRIVDCNAGNAFAYVWPHYTFELKFVDGDGTLQVALHTRLVGKALKMNLGPWANMIAKPFADGIEGVWQGGKPSEP